MNTTRHPWAVVIFACRESLPQLQRTLEAALISAASCVAIHVLVNGNQTLADSLAAEIAPSQDAADSPLPRPDLKVWFILFSSVSP